ncbi:hypothetical protein FEM48_Zijuj09G0034100 [Ziziphus jujuba var. spinosa]|uniref:Uncharacterized protein n=1 Tax=Ziziphus jujuba var. spinosa TaxID=714518 RepID=A0A978UQM1_ZIZJJ|nr:hypothetical protein FEM48_Zijuj09G0034100 [Ziziphus jujuba var. spinosa]
MVHHRNRYFGRNHNALLQHSQWTSFVSERFEEFGVPQSLSHPVPTTTASAVLGCLSDFHIQNSKTTVKELGKEYNLQVVKGENFPETETFLAKKVVVGQRKWDVAPPISDSVEQYADDITSLAKPQSDLDLYLVTKDGSFVVYVFKLDDKPRKWVDSMESLGDRLLFLGEWGCSYSVSAKIDHLHYYLYPPCFLNIILPTSMESPNQNMQ